MNWKWTTAVAVQQCLLNFISIQTKPDPIKASWFSTGSHLVYPKLWWIKLMNYLCIIKWAPGLKFYCILPTYQHKLVFLKNSLTSAYNNCVIIIVCYILHINILYYINYIILYYIILYRGFIMGRTPCKLTGCKDSFGRLLLTSLQP